MQQSRQNNVLEMPVTQFHLGLTDSLTVYVVNNLSYTFFTLGMQIWMSRWTETR